MQTVALPAALATRMSVSALLSLPPSKPEKLVVDLLIQMQRRPLLPQRRKSRSKVSKFGTMHGKGGMEFRV